MLREIKIICPTGEDGANLPATENVRSALLHCFGGYTVVPAYGAWRDPKTKQDHTETVNVISCGVPDGTRKDVPAILRTIARRFNAEAKQICTYVQHDNGVSELIYTPDPNRDFHKTREAEADARSANQWLPRPAPQPTEKPARALNETAPNQGTPENGGTLVSTIVAV